MLSFHNDKTVKAKYLDRVMAHYKADEIVQGTYWEKGKGCAVGCTIHGSDHSKYETELGIPGAIARLEDCIFEGLKNGTAKEWPLRFLKSVGVGKDLSLISWKFLHWLQTDNLKQAKKNKMPSDVIDCIAKVILVLEPMTKGEPVDQAAARSAAAESAWSAAAESAWSAAWSAARSAAESAESAAWSAAESAESARSAWSAARSAAWSAESAAESAESAESAGTKYYEKMADKLIELLKAAK